MSAAVLVLAAVLASPPAECGVRVNDTVERYPVEGSSVRQLRRAMNRGGPRRGGTRYHAYTAWEVRWWVELDRADAACSVASVDVELDVTTTLPQWQRGPDAPERLVERWRRYLDAVVEHERRHRACGVAAAGEVRRRLDALGPAPSCDELERSVEAIGHGVVERHRDREKAFDRQTRHGAGEGARLR